MDDPTTILLQCVVIAGLAATFYAVLIRPQQQRLRRHTKMLAGLRRGDRIATVGGLVGTIVRTDGEDFLVVEIAPGVETVITRKSVDMPVATASVQPAAWQAGVRQTAAD